MVYFETKIVSDTEIDVKLYSKLDEANYSLPEVTLSFILEGENWFNEITVVGEQLEDLEKSVTFFKKLTKGYTQGYYATPESVEDWLINELEAVQCVYDHRVGVQVPVSEVPAPEVNRYNCDNYAVLASNLDEAHKKIASLIIEQEGFEALQEWQGNGKKAELEECELPIIVNIKQYLGLEPIVDEVIMQEVENLTVTPAPKVEKPKATSPKKTNGDKKPKPKTFNELTDEEKAVLPDEKYEELMTNGKAKISQDELQAYLAQKEEVAF